MMSILNGSIDMEEVIIDEAVLSSPEPIEDIPEEYVPRPPSRHRPSSATSLILVKRGITLEPLMINGKDHTHKKSPKTPGILKRPGHDHVTNHHYVSFNNTSKFMGSTETVDSMPFYRKSSITAALRSPMVYLHTSFGRFNRPSEGSWRTRDSNTQVIDNSNFISFHNVTYSISQRTVFRKLPPKVILCNVSGIMKTGLNAIMGPSGSGKTSLLDIMAGRTDRKNMSGYVLINGDRQPENFQFTSGYVVQEDRLCGALTIRENVRLSAALRLTKDIDAYERGNRVDDLLDDLGLSAVADHLVGTQYIRGISGGEKKRTSIAMELIVSPAILFLDEPTSGLDAATAVSVIRILRDLSRDGRVIIMSIHQPRYSILKLCDSLTLLSKGAIVYHGPQREALPYFSTILGFRKNLHDNPADFFLDKITAVEEGLNVPRQYKASDGGRHRSNPLAKEWMNSGHNSRLNDEIRPILAKAENQEEEYSSKYATTFFMEIYHLSIRALKNLYRNPEAGILVLLQNIMLGFLTGIIFLRLKDNGDNVFIDRSGALFFSIVCNLFSTIAGLELFINERLLFLREHASGYYRVSTYFISKVFMDLIPLRIIPIPVYCVIAYWMVGLREEAGNFFFYMMTMIVLNFAGACLVFSVGALSGNLTVAQTITAIIFTITMVYGGYFISLKSIGEWMSWIQWFSIFKYAFTALAENEFKDICFESIFINNTLLYDDNTTRCNPLLSGDAYLHELGLLKYNIGYNMIGLLGIAIAMLLLAYVGLRFVKR